VPGVMQITVNDNPVRWFKERHPIRVADRVLNEGFGGTYTAYLVAEAGERGYVTTVLKRRRYLPEIKSETRSLRGMAERTAINTPIQGSAADLIKLAMVRIWRRLRERGLRSAMIVQVHDELLFEVPLEEVEEVERIAREEMEGAMELRVPLRVEIHRGKNWEEAH
ncbi:MAG: DNA polymerase, partial [Nitrospinota bacterium]